MGMDLEPMQPSADAPRYPETDVYTPGAVIWGRYNWGGWARQQELLRQWGEDLDALGFANSNDGDVIPPWACEKVADAIEAHLPELDPAERAWLEQKVVLWRTCGGYRQL